MADSQVSVTSVEPSTGSSGGGLLVEIAGAGFRLPPPAVSSGPMASPPPTLEVHIGGHAARDVRVLGSDRLTCIVPAGTPGPADVVVQNLDEMCARLPGEKAALARGFTYVLSPLTPESDLTRLVRTLLQELRRQVMDNVVLTVQTDFDAETGAELHVGQLAELPGLVLVGPELPENRFYSMNELPEASVGPNTFVRRREPYTVDLGFTIVGVSDHTTELLNLMATTQLFFHRNKSLVMTRDAANVEAGTVQYEMDIAPGGGLRTTSQPNESNVRSFSGKFVIRGFDLEDVPGQSGGLIVERGRTVDAVLLDPSEQITSRSASRAPSARSVPCR
jgi:hypothetical protein